jgi:hypothetical protein
MPTTNHQFQVLNPVVCPDSILVVNQFVWMQWSAQGARHHNNVLLHTLVWIANPRILYAAQVHVAVVDPSSSLPVWMPWSEPSALKLAA